MTRRPPGPSGRTSGPNRGTAALTVAAVLAGVLLLPATPALADTPTPAASPSEATTLPGLAQSLTDYQQNGCRKPSEQTTTRMPWPQTYLRPEAAWPLSQGAGVTVAVLGSGVDDTAGVLGPRLTVGPRQYDAGPAADCVGHGTFAAGLIAAARRPGVGFAGLAPQAGILAIGVTDQAGTTNGGLLAGGIRAAADAGARIIAVVAATPAASAELADAVRYAQARGALLIAPAGSDSGWQGQAYPAGYPGVLSVAAIGPGGTQKQGLAADIRVDLVAPGESVMSTGPGGKGYYTATGPSYAAALVAGSAALVLGYRPDLTGDQLAHRLEATAYHSGGAVPDPKLGYGTVDPVAAVTAVLPGEQAGGAPRPTAPGTPLAMPPDTGRSAASDGYAVSAGALGAALLVAGAAAVVPRGRKRRWRPGE
ncbi:S8 family serine peptidase [Kitasatospora sp. NPDC049285]|uniref:S8 family serine peptidase n=1 Tax=Kitasatospora sp. NPDC049285 TaxID=3157096 RepID=UPI00342C9145